MDNLESIRHLLLATNKIDGIYYLCTRKLGMKYTTLTLLYAINDQNPHSQKKICDDWLIPKTTLNTIVKDMIAKGYIVFSTEKRSREKDIILTDAGLKYSQPLVKHLYEAESVAYEKTMQKYSPEFVEAFDWFAENLCDELNKRILSKKKE